jgi:hypothetical protein
MEPPQERFGLARPRCSVHSGDPRPRADPSFVNERAVPGVRWVVRAQRRCTRPAALYAPSGVVRAQRRCTRPAAGSAKVTDGLTWQASFINGDKEDNQERGRLVRVPGRIGAWAVLGTFLFLTAGAAAFSAATSPRMPLTTRTIKATRTTKASQRRRIEATTSPTSTTTTLTTTTEVASSGPQVTLAYAGSGVGIVGIETQPEGAAAPHLFLTHDFEHFTDVTPPALLAGPVSDYGAFEQAFFLNPEDGWVSTFNGAAAQVVVYRTTDGGLSWTTVAGTNHTANAGAVAYLQFLSPSFGYLDNLQPTGPAADLSVTYNGGNSWQHIAAGPGPSQLPVGRAVFVDASHAVAVANALGCAGTSTSNIWTSSDGGMSWASAVLPAPFVPSSTVSICPDAPFPTPSGVVVPASLIVSRATARVGFLVSTSEGQVWHAEPGPPVNFDVTFSPSVLGDVGTAAGGAAVAGDGSWWVVGRSTSGSDEVWVTNKRAWLVTNQGPNLRLYGTWDGGSTWTEPSV